jgi:hypothetical protein
VSELLAWGLGFLAILLAILLGVVIALISESDGEIKNDGSDLWRTWHE